MSDDDGKYTRTSLNPYVFATTRGKVIHHVLQLHSISALGRWRGRWISWQGFDRPDLLRILFAVNPPTTPYAPASRRPIADLFRRTADAAVRACVARNVHPDVISLTSVVAAALAGECFI